MNRIKIFPFFFIFLPVGLFFGCQQNHGILQGFDSNVWKGDRNGCAGHRLQFYDTLRAQEAQLHGLTEMEVIALFGRPDKNELYNRKQKFYYYYLEPSSRCGDFPDSTALQLFIRFNALGLAKDIVFQQ